MALYFLEYDLRKQRDYKKLYNELATFKAVRILESLWCFHRVNATAEGLRDLFRNYIDRDDGIVVAHVVDWAAINTRGNPNLIVGV